MSSVKIPVVFQVEPVQSSCLLRPPPLISHALETGGCGPSIAPIYIYSTVQTRARPGHRTLVINKQNLTGQPTYIYTHKNTWPVTRLWPYDSLIYTYLTQFVLSVLCTANAQNKKQNGGQNASHTWREQHQPAPRRDEFGTVCCS